MRSVAPRRILLPRMLLIRTYRVRGHLAANLDPLGLLERQLPADLTPEYHGFKEADLDREMLISAARSASRPTTVRELVTIAARQLLR